MMTLYGLLYNDDLMTVRNESNEGKSFCNDTTYTLDHTADDIWVTKDIEVAKRVSAQSECWFNSSYEAPVNSYVGKLKIVKFTVEEVILPEGEQS